MRTKVDHKGSQIYLDTHSRWTAQISHMINHTLKRMIRLFPVSNITHTLLAAGVHRGLSRQVWRKWHFFFIIQHIYTFTQQSRFLREIRLGRKLFKVTAINQIQYTARLLQVASNRIPLRPFIMDHASKTLFFFSPLRAFGLMFGRQEDVGLQVAWNQC